VGHDSTERRGEARLVLAPGSTLLLFSDGLVDSPTHSLHDGLARLRRAAESGPATPDALCEHVLRHHPAGLRADDHVSVLALGLSSATARGPAGG
jgi:serine/threonine-protein kinase RsbW